METIMKLKELKEIDKDDLLRFVGLQSKRTAADWILPTIGLFALGALVGAGVVLMVAPKSGRNLREDLEHRARGATEGIADSFSRTGPSNERPPRTL